MSAPTITLTDKVASLEYVEITWANTGQDTNFWAYRIYLRVPGSNEERLIYETTDATGPYTIESYFFVQNQATTFTAVEVTQDPSSGFLTETWAAPKTITIVWDDQYHLIYDLSPASGYNITFPGVVSDSWTNEREREIVNVLGRGRKQNIGSNWGRSGSLTVLNYGTDQETINFEREIEYAVASLDSAWWLIDPFGSCLKVAISDCSVDRMSGVGINAMSTVNLDYRELG